MLVTSIQYRMQLMQNNAALKNLSAQMLAKLIVAKPAEVEGLYKSLVQQYMDQGGKAVEDEFIKNYKAQNSK